MVELVAYLILIGLVVLPIAIIGRSAVTVRRRGRARLSADGTQEIEVLVRGRFRPSTIVIRQGIPARLYFNRQEDGPYSQQVIFSEPRRERQLAPFATTLVQFIATHPGEFLFTCSTGLYRGRLVVEK